MKAPPGLLLLLLSLMASFAEAEIPADLAAKAETGDPAAQWELAEIHAKGQGVTRNLPEAVKWYSKAAEQGNGEAQMKLGGLFIGGKGVLKSSVDAAKWFMMSAEQGNPAAQCQIGRMYMAGAGVPKDDIEAYKWSELAAGQGDLAAKKVVAFLIRRMTPAQVAEGQQRSRDFADRKKAEKTLDLPADPAPVEPLPLIPPE